MVFLSAGNHAQQETTPMTERELQLTIIIRRHTEWANEAAAWVCLNPANADHWRHEAAKFRALAAAAEVDLQIARAEGV